MMLQHPRPVGDVFATADFFAGLLTAFFAFLAVFFFAREDFFAVLFAFLAFAMIAPNLFVLENALIRRATRRECNRPRPPLFQKKTTVASVQLEWNEGAI